MRNTPEPTGVRVDRDGPIAHLRLDGAARLNAIGTHTCEALASAVREIDADRGVRAVVVEGPGRAFCAGADIAEIAEFVEPAEFSSFVHGFTDALELIERSPVPFVAAITGPAFGGGLELALACDLRVTARAVPLGLPEAKLGVLPGAGGTVRLPRLVPRGIAYELLVRGTPITGERGYQLGLVNVLCDAADEVPAAALELAQELAAGAPLVADRAKSLLRETALLDVHDGIERERVIATELFASDDGREGFAAFVARRPAKFGTERT